MRGWRVSWPRWPNAISSARTATAFERLIAGWQLSRRGSSSVGGAAAFQAACRGFEPRLQLHSLATHRACCLTDNQGAAGPRRGRGESHLRRHTWRRWQPLTAEAPVRVLALRFRRHLLSWRQHASPGRTSQPVSDEPAGSGLARPHPAPPGQVRTSHRKSWHLRVVPAGTVAAHDLRDGVVHDPRVEPCPGSGSDPVAP